MASLMEHRRRLMAEKTFFVPPEYQRVEYITGDGSSYIDTGIECISDLTVDFVFSVSTTEQKAMCGGINQNTPLFRHHGLPYKFGKGNIYMYNYAPSGADIIPTNIAEPQLDTWYHIIIDPTAGTYLFEGENYYESGTFTPPATARTTGRGYGILARISQAGAIQGRPCKFKTFKFKRRGILLGYFVPVYRKTDNVAGMYDAVTQAFFANAGSGTIGVGPNV